MSVTNFKTSLLALGLALLSALPALSEESGLLLGLQQSVRTPNQPQSYSPEDEYRYFTVWIYPSGQTYKYARGPEVLVPRDDGFWQVGVDRYTLGDWVEDVPYAHPVGAPAKTKPQEPAATNGHTSKQITYVGPKGMSLLTHSHGYSEGAAHPWNNWNFETVDLDNLDRSLNIQSVLGQAGERAQQSGLRDYLAFNSQRKKALESSVRTNGWGVVRDSASWSLLGFVGHSSEVYRGSYALFKLPTSLPKEISAHDTLSLPWEEVKRKIPGALDAFQGPEGSPLVIVTLQYLHVFEGPGEPRPTLTVDLGAPTEAVMAEWAVGSPNVRRWTKAVLDFIGADI